MQIYDICIVSKGHQDVRSCLFSDLLARTLLAPAEFSISTVTAVLGAPVVIAVMMKKYQRRG